MEHPLSMLEEGEDSFGSGGEDSFGDSSPGNEGSMWLATLSGEQIRLMAGVLQLRPDQVCTGCCMVNREISLSVSRLVGG